MRIRRRGLMAKRGPPRTHVPAAALLVAVLHAVQLAAIGARQCTVMPLAPSAANQSTAAGSGNASQVAAANASNATATDAHSARPPLSTPPPQTPPIEVGATPISSHLEQEAAQITSDLQALNQSIRNFTHSRNFFPDVQLNRDLESFVAAVLFAAGLFACVLGAQHARVVMIVMAFFAGIVTSMYPIDAMFGDILCGPFACPPDDNDSEEFCGWAMAAGVVAGIISASAGGKLFDLGLVAFGAGLALLPALLLQPVFDYALQAHASWTRYVHYLVFGALGAGLAKKFPHVLLISISSVLGALLMGLSLSYFLDAGLTPASISGGRSAECTGPKCIGMACGVGVTAVLSAAFQTWYKKRRDARESGQFIEDKLESNLSAQQRVLQRLEALEDDLAARFFVCVNAPGLVCASHCNTALTAPIAPVHPSHFISRLSTTHFVGINHKDRD